MGQHLGRGGGKHLLEGDRRGQEDFALFEIVCFALSCCSDCMNNSEETHDEYDDRVVYHHDEHHKKGQESQHRHKSDIRHAHNDPNMVKIQNGDTTVNLPFKYVHRGIGCVVMTHGLGAKNPRVKTHENDEWLNDVIIPAVETSGSIDYCAYTARGHGDSTGWETTGEVDGDQFTWKRLGHDMLDVASYLGISSFVSAGSSQGSATALFAAMYDPTRVKAVIMLRPPSAWNRKPQKKLESAEKCRERHPDEMNYLCLKGTAYSDLPPRSDPSYAALKQKVLILTVEGDVAHPVSTAKELNSLLPDSSLHIAASPEDAVRDWPGVIQTFLATVKM